MTLKEPGRIGTIYEHVAINEFLKKGFLVFKNVMQQGPADIVVVSPEGEIELLDVKKRSVRKRDGLAIYRCLTTAQKKLNIKLYYVDDQHPGHYHPPKGIK
jgi:hypothetical protein|tara:strand:+ start:170 stop:472 length:303 start_codon:yes stop_codon:yes gene_type:complete